MALNILDRYGIKEVADVTFYEIDSNGAPSAPVLYLDTLKVSTIEQSAESTDATGGKGNPPLISWDYGKEITVTLEDALFSVKSLAIMFGGTVDVNATSQEVLKTLPASQIKYHPATTTPVATAALSFVLNDTEFYIPDDAALGYKYGTITEGGVNQYGVNDGVHVKAATWATDAFDFITFDLLDMVTSRGGSTTAPVKGLEIEISADKFPGTYYVTGDTYARNQQSGLDEYFQFIIPKAKVQPTDLSLTMEAEGDPSTFSMTLKVLRTPTGGMMKLVKYGIGESGTDVYNKGVGSIVTSSDMASPAANWDSTKSSTQHKIAEKDSNVSAGSGNEA